MIERAESVGVRLGFREHATCGVPMTLLAMVLAMAWLLLCGAIAW